MRGDLVEQLRVRGTNDIADGYEDKAERGKLDLQAAEEIERLRGQLAAMKRCTFGGAYGRCQLEAGHEGRHDLV